MAQATSRQLDEAERKVAEALGLAADMSDQLAAHVQLAPDGARAETEAACRRTQQQFLQLVREIRAAMVEASAGARNFRPTCRSMYGAQTDGSIGDAKMQMVRQMLRDIEATASGGSQAEEAARARA